MRGVKSTEMMVVCASDVLVGVYDCENGFEMADSMYWVKVDLIDFENDVVDFGRQWSDELISQVGRL